MYDINQTKTLLIGIGNSGRKDDGLGWALVEHVRERGLFLGDTILRYQLQVEDAELISHYDTVVFVDAYHDILPLHFELRACKAAPSFSFSSHDIAPESILFLCQDLYNSVPNAYLLLIEGKEWQLELGLSTDGQRNLNAAIDFVDENF